MGVYKHKTLFLLIFSILLSKNVAVIAADYGKGFAAAKAGDYETAYAEWITLANKGHMEAQASLALMYRKGLGVAASDKTAVEWYRKAAEQGDASSIFNMGYMYYKGRGVLESYSTAAEWFTKAARQGHAKAQGALGEMYSNGEGVAVNNIKAYMWLNLAAYNTSRYSKYVGKIKAELAKKMTVAQIGEAQDRSSRCLESEYADC